ncbi:PolC-type DNA polymerase III [Parasporobacterium paucivorans]|uniref:DNA polymerase III PolC-type n=1 Tax=Parasporobacterium paucivorans DSM 15970 TaxID=1122934 RepID=A0A1M6AFR8_9FIRM|nr:PolC-type DNA polymerase III [Parasporobacterium paucivorans]SHI35309.1 DNA polymerase-3 subunit alpha [Parasporobacterium paucivorans DSM 15970]
MNRFMFFDVFPTLEVNNELGGLFREVEVKKVTTTSAKSSLRVHIENEKPIPKDKVFIMEETIRKQVCGYAAIKVEIVEKYNMSGRYSLGDVLSLYKDSVFFEIKNTNTIGYSILKSSQIIISGENSIKITVEDGLIHREKTTKLKSILEEILVSRCSLDISIDVVYIAKTNKIEIISQEPVEAAFAPETVSIPAADKDKMEKTIADPEKNKKKKKQPDGLLYGRDFEGKSVSLKDVVFEMEEVIVDGKIVELDKRETKSGKTILIFTITDFTDSISVKLFLKPEQTEEIGSSIQKGMFIRLKGTTRIDKFDNELTIGSVYGIRKSYDFTEKRMDTSLQKRVELHCHTKMSDMDGMTEIRELIHTAVEWGHKAVAITDHGVAQGFTEAFHVYNDLKADYKKQKKEFDFKLIYGIEGYIVDDLIEIVQNSRNQFLDDTYVVFDIETTGLNAQKNEIIEIGAVKMTKGVVTDNYSAFVNPGIPIPYRIEELTGITDSMVAEARNIDIVLPEFLAFCEGAVLVAHNSEFDTGFIKEKASKRGIGYDYTSLDTVALARMLLPNLKRYKLDNIAKALDIPLDNHHRAVDDARCTALIFIEFINRLKKQGIERLDQLNTAGEIFDSTIKKLPTHHIIILAKNEVGRVNLYTLISKSHINYFHMRPRIPKSELLKHREGLIIGSACASGELYDAILMGKDTATISRLAQFYDYFEIQPLGNNGYLVRDEKTGVHSVEDLMEINRKIVKLGEEFNKPVVATCDNHFLNPEDEIYRRIIMSGKKFADSDEQPPLFFRTTEEMLEEFAYLGEEKTKEVVIDNTNLIADMVEYIEPVRPDKCPPVIADSDKTLKEICYRKANSMYGENLPDIVTARLERELESIISNGFAVMYIIAQKLVWKSNEDGYLVGSRGSVGSSFVATMAGITEVNPLPPHYYCPQCHFSDFDSDLVSQYQGASGCDMPDRLCPDCGHPLNKDGFDIPFETFLGFKGNKEPDIDLNFSGEYQSKAHEYTEVIFGKGQTFRAGTISTLQDKTAYGYVKNYFEERGIIKRKCEISRILSGCVGVRRSTGQHPGGIIVMPHGENINSFTPVQRPANDMETKTITTHFDYHSIDHNLLKLDILGHDDPTMIRKLEIFTGIDAKNIRLDNKEVLSLFENTSALGIRPEDIDGCKLGVLGIPEFGTDFVIQMLLDTKPKNFSDLVRISGLSHGTNVWLSNAQTVIKEGKATLATAICTRDDIMLYLITKNLDPELAFTIMEAVRKGKGLKPEWEAEMLAHDVPDWYIWSCNRISYMFPKAHAAAYVMMAFRIAYFKVFHPLAYYAAYFSIRATAFNYEIMCGGREKFNHYFAEYKKKAELGILTNKDEDTFKELRIVQEMYARGIDFEPLDIYRAKAKDFQIIDGKLMPSLSTVEGLGEKAAEAVEAAAKHASFLSKDDFKNRTKASKTVIDLMDQMGILNSLPATNQLSLFDM